MFLKVLIGGYGFLSLIAAVAQGKYKNIGIIPALLLGVGGIFMIATLFIDSIVSVYILSIGVILVHISAIISGYKMYGELNKSQNIARLVVSIFLVASQMMNFVN